MGGLLDKANAAKEPETDDKPLEVEPAPVVQQKASAAPQKASTAAPVSGSPDNATKLNLAGWVIILLGAILSLQGGSWGFAVVAVVLVLGIGAIVQADRMRGSVSKPKLYATLVVALLVASGPYILVMVFPLMKTTMNWILPSEGVFHRLMLRFVPKERPSGRVLQK